MLIKILRWILQIILVVLVGFFGYNYLTHEELRECVTTPLASLSGKSDKIDIDEEKVALFMDNFGNALGGVVEKGENLWEKLQEASSGAEASTSAEEKKLADQLVDKGKYLYCKSVVERVEKEK